MATTEQHAREHMSPGDYDTRTAEDIDIEQCAADELERQAHGDGLVTQGELDDWGSPVSENMCVETVSDLAARDDIASRMLESVYVEEAGDFDIDLSACRGKHAVFLISILMRSRKTGGMDAGEIICSLMRTYPGLRRAHDAGDDPFAGVAS